MMSNTPIRTLLFSTLFPSSARPGHGIFIETRLKHLLASGQVETRVVAPVPWFPSANPRFGVWAKFAATPGYEIRDGIEVWHPRYFLPPKVGMHMAPYSLAATAIPLIRKLMRDGFDFDLIDAHYYYPDGVAAALVARHFGKPFVVSARGSDLNLLSTFDRPRKLILRAADQAAASIGVSQALMDVLRNLGADPAKLHVMRNGVDLQKFRPLNKAECRSRLNLPPGRLAISVGHLVELKGHQIAVEAIAAMPDWSLVIAGEGPFRAELERQINALGVSDRVRLAGAVPNQELVHWYNAADVLLLASSREGWANVLLESMACGTPAIATAVGGSPEVIQGEVAGALVNVRSASAFVDALTRFFRAPPDQQAVRRYAEDFSWDATTDAQLSLFRKICSSSLVQPDQRGSTAHIG